MTTMNQFRAFRVSLDTSSVPAFREAIARAGYETEDTGERIVTDAGMDAETVLLVSVPREACMTRAERVAQLLRP